MHPHAKRLENENFKRLIERTIEELPDSPSLPGGLLTLLDVPNRRELPPIPMGRRPLLIDLVQFDPGTYSRFVGAMKKGAYYHAAAESVGLSTAMLKEWGKLGKKDFEAGKDTYYARFYQDVRKAIAQCRVAVEQAVAMIDPRKWLAKGPGKIFGDEWSDDPKNSDLQEPNPTFIESAEPVALIEGTGVQTTVISLDQQTEEETLDVLKEVLKDRSIVKKEE